MTTLEGINSVDYDPLKDLQELLPDPSTLENLKGFMNYTNSYKLQVDADIQRHHDEFEEYLESDDRFDATEAHGELDKIIDEINENKKLGVNTQNVITDMTSGIKKLDDAKKNLVLSMTVLKRLQMLLTAYEQLEEFATRKRYTESVQLLSAVGELVDHFKSYKSIDSIADLTRKVSKLKIQITDQIFQDFENTLNEKDNSIKTSELKSSCEMLDLIGNDHHNRLINWFCNQQLKEIKSIFISSDEAGSLENISRRFLFFKKLLKIYEQNYQLFFPDSWKVEEQLTLRFCEHTKDSIKQVLATSGKDTNVDLMLSSLQETLEFEKFLNAKFKYRDTEEILASSTDNFNDKDDSPLKPKFSQSISSAFEPFLGIWVDHQNTFLNNKFLEFLSSPKLPPKDDQDNNDHSANVIPSSADLFRAYRHLLTQCSTLSTGAPLRDLSKLFSKWSLEYSNKIMKPVLPNVATNDESIQYITLVLNTADYCSTTISQLEERLILIIDEPFKSSINFDQVKDSFIKLINSSINLLLNKIEIESEFSWREMANTNWSHMEDVGDQSRYITSLKDVLVSNGKLILPAMVRDIYVRNLCDKIVELTINQFLTSIIKTKPIPVIAAEQMLLDLSVLKETFLKLPKLSNDSPDYKIPVQYQKHVDKMVNRLEIILKVLLTQEAPQEGLVSNYFFLIGDKSITNFIKILQLKGINDKNRQLKFIDLFKIHIKAHDNLIENSPILSKILINESDHSNGQTIPSSSGILSSYSQKITSPDIPSTPKFDNLFGKRPDINLEKGLKELALNGEAGVSKFNENFQKFGRFFRKDNNGNNE
ncbi:hypothetical protein BN7_391 [Wickerhamomyces ciferrii]|uniref:Uncharacterized protein n=1 Tax=Wickerhamomyces ciferrii (strain ATCC 14091 / BCRC 22168 / CBS 111 / JCM 3599 / NBRC 0793 / NRRL Y-1031 F-60-10) TaxID=1206466 RepID=K0KF62_WICCF|nr:uncharacterized protein BN7_391 [Wickerhamomyces ciferrii]CCH40857.1 hypothetical protein BN7_391 [Wickerhamomyces ciferrii]